MKRLSLALIISLLLTGPALALTHTFSGLTGGVSPDLDSIAVAEIADGEIAIGVNANLLLCYEYSSASTAEESSPTVIVPDDNASDGRWLLRSTYAMSDHIAAADPHAGYVLESLFNAYSVPYSDTDNTPAMLALSTNQIVGRLAAGIVAIDIGTSAGDVAAGDHAHSGTYEPVLGNPGTTGYVLSSTDAGVRSWVAQTGGYTNLTSFVAQTAWRLFYSNTDGDVTELALGSDGTYLRSNGAAAAPTFDTPSGAAHDAVTLSTDIGNNLLGLSTQQITLDDQTANYIFAGPATGAAAAPAFRAMVDADIPSAIARDTELHAAVTLGSGIGGLSLSTQELSLSARLEAYHDFTDPDADRVWGWDDSAGAFAGFSLGNSLAFTLTVLDTIQDIRTTATPQFARIGIGQAAHGTNPIASSGFSVDPDGDVTMKSATITKASGVAGDMGLYEANSTDTHAAGRRGPASITGDGAYRGQYANARATSANMVEAWTNAGESGTGTAADPYIQQVSWVDLDLYLLISAIDDAPVDSETAAPISSNWAYDHAATAASDSAAGHIELATTAETTTGTATDRAVTPDGLSGSVYGQKEIGWTIHNATIDTAVADGAQAAVIPASMNGMNLIDLTCSVADLNSAASGSTTVVLRRVRGATAADMTSTGVTIAYNEYTASDETVDTSNDDVATGDKIYVDVNAVTTAVHKGLSCTAVFQTP